MTAALTVHPPSPLRPYQRAAVDAVLAARRAGRRRLLVHLPTGAGKTVIFAHLAKLARRQVLVLAHREELLAQARDKLVRALDGDAVVDIERGRSGRPRRRRWSCVPEGARRAPGGRSGELTERRLWDQRRVSPASTRMSFQ